MSAPATATIENLRRRKSGASANNLGGAIHADEVSNNVTHNIWRKITEEETQAGITIFRGFYIYNNHATEAIKNIILYFGTPVTNSGLEISLAQGTSALTAASVEPIIASETTTPTILGTWAVSPGDRSSGLAISADINPGAHAFVWMRMIVPSGTQSSVFTHYRMKVEAFNPLAAGNIPETWGMVFAANMECNTITNNVLTKITKRDFQYLQTVGNNSNFSTDPSCFIKQIKDIGLRPKTKICLGVLDEYDLATDFSAVTKNSTKWNALKTEFGMTSEYYSYDVYNVHFTVMKNEDNYNIGSAQYNWVKQDLETARQRPGITWLVVVCNAQAYSVTSPWPFNARDSFRDTYHPLFMANFVHVVIGGSAPRYERLKCIKYNPAEVTAPIPVQDDQSGDYTWYDKGMVDGGSVFINIGSAGTQGDTAGAPTQSKPTQIEFWTWLADTYTVIQFNEFGTKMTGAAYNVNDDLFDKWSITHVLPP